MPTVEEQIAAANAAQSAWKNAPPAPPLPPAPAKANFAPARPVIKAIVADLNAQLHHGLSLTIDDNDTYWPNGGLRVDVHGGKTGGGSTFWAADDGSVRMGGNPHLNQAGVAVGPTDAVDADAIQHGLIQHLLRASGAEPITPPTL